MKLLVVIALFAGAGFGIYWLVIRDAPPRGPATVSITAAQVSFTKVGDGDGDGDAMTVIVEVEATSPQAAVGPHLVIDASCAGATDRATGTVGLLANAPAGERTTDTIELFRVRPFAQLPGRCEVAISWNDGSGSPARYCYELEQTIAGGC